MSRLYDLERKSYTSSSGTRVADTQLKIPICWGIVVDRRGLHVQGTWVAMLVSAVFMAFWTDCRTIASPDIAIKEFTYGKGVLDIS
jgi:hypothetical protein